MRKVFTSELIEQQLSEKDLENLVNKFEKFKNLGDRQNYFGKDEDFNRPQSVVSAGLRHVHLNEKPRRPWNMKIVPIEDSTSDIHLVYCQGFFHSDHYLLISFLLDAHERYRNTLFMLNLVDIADEFRNRY